MFYLRVQFLITAVLFSYITYTNASTSSNDNNEKKFDPPLGLAPIPWPKDNPYTKQKAELGKLLYFDKRLSSNQTISCASCHNMPCAFSDCRAVAVGIDDAKGTRHSPRIINAAYAAHLFWDGRAASLEEQCQGPIANPNEMTIFNDVHEAHKKCVECVRKIPGYKALFIKAFGAEDISLKTISQAIATFERTILSGNSAYDRYRAGDKSALKKAQTKGMEVFKKSGCMNCHAGFNFSDERFLNIGIGMDAANPDLGRYLITHAEKDWGAFKVPTLREAARSGPYMHDGSLKTLEAVIEYYDKGGNKNKNLHPLIKPLHLSQDEKKALLNFLEALNGEGWQNIQEPRQFPE